MVAKIDAKLFGNDKTQWMFHNLPDKVQRRVIRKAVNAAATPVVKQLRRNLPKDTGALKRAVSKKVITTKDKTLITGLVGWDRKKEYAGKKGSRYAHLVENGYISRDGKFVPGKYPLRKAFESTKTMREAQFGRKLGMEIEKEANKMGAKGKGSR